MKKIILISAIALLAACGSSDKKSAVGDSTEVTSPAVENSSGGDSTAAPVEGSDDTISVEDFGDMPPKCIELLATLLKQIEPTVSGVDWETETMGEFRTLSEQIETNSTAFDTQSNAAGCDKYNLTGSDDKQFQQMAELAATEAPGTIGYITFLRALTASQTATAVSLPTDCASTTAAIEPFLAKGSFDDLTVDEVGVVQQLLGAVNSNCTTEEAAAFFGRDDVTAFVGS